jgi:hypothetical protein
MKKLLTATLILVAFAAFAPSFVSAQITQDDVNLVQAMYGKNKRDLMKEYLKFKDAASEKAFWGLYDKYEGERKKLGQDYIGILNDYAKNYEKLDDKTSNELVTRTSANNVAYENLYSKYYRQMLPVVGARTAAQFFQVEGYLRSVIRVKAMDQIPFIGEMDRTKAQHPQQ